jgi:hypothetical protein
VVRLPIRMSLADENGMTIFGRLFILNASHIVEERFRGHSSRSRQEL